MTLDPPFSTAAKPPSLASQLATMRETATRKLEAALKAPPKTAIDTPVSLEAAAIKSQTEEMAKARRLQAKDHARLRVMELIERVKVIKQFGGDNPAVMARQLASLSKDLKKAIDAYAEAGGSTAGWQTSLEKPAPADPGEPPADAYAQMRDQVKGSEASSDMELVKMARGLAKTIRELLEEAKVQFGVAGPDEESKAFIEETETTMKEVDKTLEGLDRAIRASSPAAGMFVALYA